MESDRQLRAEIVQSGTWLYGNEVLSEVWIVKQNFEYHYEEEFSDGPEELNPEGESFQVLFARNGQKIALGPAKLSLSEAILAAEQVVPVKITWTNHTFQMLYGGRWYSVTPMSNDEPQLG